MKEACVIIPKTNNDGQCLEWLRDKTVKHFCQYFGGATVIETQGYWLNDSGELFADAGWQIVTACKDDRRARWHIRYVARDVLIAGKQQAVYMRYASGEVEFMELRYAESVGHVEPSESE